MRPVETPFDKKERAPKGSKWLEPKITITPKVICTICGSDLPSEIPLDGKCPNCGADYAINSVQQGIHDNTPAPKGKQHNPYSVKNPAIVNTGKPLVAESLLYDSKNNSFIQIHASKDKKKKTEDEELFKSEEFKQFAGPSDEYMINDDNLDIEQTVSDLAIDD